MKADIFIPTKNRLVSLNLLFKSLEIQSKKTFNILLIGDKKSNRLAKLIKNHKKLKINYSVSKNRGLVNASNEALKRVRGDIFIRIDDDVVLSKNWFKAIVETFSKNAAVGAVTGPTIIDPDRYRNRDSIYAATVLDTSENPLKKTLWHILKKYLYENKIYNVSTFTKGGSFTLGSNFKKCLKIKNPIDVTNLEACNFAIRTNILKDLGGFDTIFAKGLGEYHEADIAFKIRRSGYKIFFHPKAAVEHRVEKQEVSTRPDSFNRIRNFIIFYKRQIGIKSPAHLLGFSLNLIAQNSYYLYKFFTTGKLSNLGALPGTISGLFLKK